MRSKRYVCDNEFARLASDLNLSLEEFLILMYFDNTDSKVFDIETIIKRLGIKREKILEAVNKLLEKKLILLKSAKDSSNKRYDLISLDNYYLSLSELSKNIKDNKTTSDIFTLFEKEFKRPLNGMEYEIIKSWLEKQYKEEIIKEALKEALYNGATNIRYVDTILYEWNTKGILTIKDLTKYRNDFHNHNANIDEGVLDYDWLSDDGK